MSSHSDSCKQLSMKSNPSSEWLSYLIIKWHQQSPESTNRCCHDIFHCVIQREAQQEEKASIKQQAQNAALQRGSKLSSLGLESVSDRARVKAVSSQLDTSPGCHISTFCIFVSFHFYCKAAKLCGGYSSFILSSIHSTEEQNYSSLVQETLLLKSAPIFWLQHLLPHHPPQNHHVFSSLPPVSLGGMLALPPKVRWKCVQKYSFCFLLLAHCSMSRLGSFSPPTENAHHEAGSDNRSERVNAKNRFVTKVTLKKKSICIQINKRTETAPLLLNSTWNNLLE